MSGDLRRDQRISKAGNPMVRATMLELAWVWLRRCGAMLRQGLSPKTPPQGHLK
jgi:hypothetical protein